MTGTQLALELRQDIEAIDHADGQARRDAAPGELGTAKVYFAYRDAGIEPRIHRLEELAEGLCTGVAISMGTLDVAAVHAVLAFELCVYAALIEPDRDLAPAIRKARAVADELIHIVEMAWEGDD